MRLYLVMTARDETEEHRVATPLELFFDLTFVVAIAQAAANLHHGLVDGHGSDTIIGFSLSFFAIWWAWMNLTWFASAYDPDDALFRIMVMVQMVGVLIFAAGIPRAFDHQNLKVMTAGYVVMRVAMVGQWIRAAVSNPDRRRCALRYAAGISILQVFWLLRLALDGGDGGLVGFAVLAAAELAVPVWAERAGRTTWHPHHLAERYGLFTIIVLGESLLAATIGVQSALDADTGVGDLATVIVGGLLIVFSMWWIYFDLPIEEATGSARARYAERLGGAFGWGYGHVLVFAGAAATGAGISVAVDQVTHHSELSDLAAACTVTVPTTIYLVITWLLHRRLKPKGPMRTWAIPLASALVLATSITPEPVLLTGVVLALLVAAHVAHTTITGAARAPA